MLAACDEHGIAVVPFGGGTSVVGGVDPERGTHDAVIALDLAPTAALLDLDETSLLATFGAGTTGPQAEELLSARGYTLGHFPQSYEYATIGGYAATRSSGQASRGYGRFDDLVHALRIATPVGELSLGRRTRERGRTRPARAVPRIRGRVRRAHRGHRAHPPGARRHEVRRVDASPTSTPVRPPSAN